MSPITKVFFWLFALALVLVFLLSPSMNEKIASDILSEKITSDKWNGEAQEDLAMLTVGTKFQGKWQINKPLKSDWLNVYLLKPGFLSQSEKQYELLKNLENNCAYLGTPNMVVCDGQFLQQFMSNRVASTPYFDLTDKGYVTNYDTINEISERSDEDDLLLWMLGHELGHVVHRDSPAHFQASAFDRFVSSKSLSQHIEVEADAFLAQQLKKDIKRREQMLGYLQYLLELEIAQRQQSVITSNKMQSFVGPGLHAYLIPVSYITTNSHPEYVIRCVRLLDLLDLKDYSPELNRELGVFTTSLKAQNATN
jgi:hypothetical protein